MSSIDEQFERVHVQTLTYARGILFPLFDLSNNVFVVPLVSGKKYIEKI